jgi:hypothetical protein
MPRNSWHVLSVLALALGALTFATAASAHDGKHHGHHGNHHAKSAGFQLAGKSAFKHDDKNAFKQHDKGEQNHHNKGEHKRNDNNTRFTTTLTSPDTGTCQNVWANDVLQRTYIVHKSHDGTYSLTAFDRGTFTTVAGASPEACNTTNSHHGTVVTAGIQGRIFGFISGKVIGGTFDPNATCAAICDRAAFLSAHFGPTATNSCSVPQSCRYFYLYHAKDEALTSSTWIDRGKAGSTGPLETSDRGDIATA